MQRCICKTHLLSFPIHVYEERLRDEIDIVCVTGKDLLLLIPKQKEDYVVIFKTIMHTDMIVV